MRKNKASSNKILKMGKADSDYQEVPSTNSEPILRRSSREKQPPEYHELYLLVLIEKNCKMYIEKEMKFLKDNEVWELDDRATKGRKAVGSK